jgi:DNA-binding Lrp family transcriptional regulator
VTTLGVKLPISDQDEHLLALLRENARLSTSALAREMGVSRTTVQNRLERLERDGVIAGYTIRTGEAYERSLLRAQMAITVAPKKTAGVVAALRKMDEVRKLHSVGGSFDMIADVAARDVGALDQIIDTIGALDGVERTMSSIILSTRIDR